MTRFESAKELYGRYGVDVEQAMAKVAADTAIFAITKTPPPHFSLVYYAFSSIILAVSLPSATSRIARVTGFSVNSS